MGQLARVRDVVNDRTWKVLSRAEKRCEGILEQVRSHLDEYIEDRGLDSQEVCFVAVGSVGRREALEASDLDLVPVLRNTEALEKYFPHDQEIRKLLRNRMQVKVSKGQDLTKPVDLDELTSSEAIGGDKDNSSSLTKRILVLSEGVSAGGRFDIREIRRAVLDAYARADRTRGRHVLTLCNDVARYYRTLAIEYKAKVDHEAKDWCTRNLKLRHSRKLWYFGIIVTVASLAKHHPHGQSAYVDGLLSAFDKPTYLRIFDAVGSDQPMAVGHLLERYCWFLEFMSSEDHRKALARVKHDERYTVSMDNPFPAMKMNSDLMHQEMLNIIEALDPHVRRKVFDWFLL